MTKSYASLAFRKTMHCYFLNYVHCTKYGEKGQNYCCTRVDPVFQKFKIPKIVTTLVGFSLLN